MTDRVTIRGVEIAFSDVGSGHPFLWGHGGLASRDREDAMLFLGPMLARQASERRTVRWDARGHGGSSGTPDPDTYRFEEHGRDLIALADALGIERFATGGLSMGAASALTAALQAPDRVTALVLMGPPPMNMGGHANEALADVIEEHGSKIFAQGIANLPVPEPFADRPELFREAFDPTVPDELLPTVLRGGPRSAPVTDEQLATVATPTLILSLAGDPIHPLAVAEHMAGIMPHATHHVAHTFADLEGFIDVISSFLSEAAPVEAASVETRR